MSKLSEFHIEFDDPLSVYQAGTLLKGKVIIVLNEPTEMRGVRLNFLGQAKTKWEEARVVTDNSNTTTYDNYSDIQDYFDKEITIWGNDKEVNQTVTMLPGRQELNFSFLIPVECPCSYEGKYGFIRYIVFAKIDRKWLFDYRTKRPFIVLGKYDLNADPRASQPLTASEEKILGCWCCHAGHIVCEVEVPRRGYVAGQVVPALIKITNNSSRIVEKMTLKLFQQVTFSACCDNSKQTKVVATTLAEAKSQFNQRSIHWAPDGLRIPPVPLTLTDCKIIEIGYFVEAIVWPSGLSFSFDATVPFIVGSIPLSAQLAQLRQSYRQFSIESGGGDPYECKPPSYPMVQSGASNEQSNLETPPPTYVEATTGKVSIKDESDNEHTSGQLEYTPRYSYYDWASAPAADQRQSYENRVCEEQL